MGINIPETTFDGVQLGSSSFPLVPKSLCVEKVFLRSVESIKNFKFSALKVQVVVTSRTLHTIFLNNSYTI